MNLDVLMRISAILASIFGLQLLLLPAQSLAIYNLDLTASGEQMARLYACLLLGFGLINWLAANTGNSAAKRAIVIGDCLADCLSLVVICFAIFQGNVNAMGWIDAAISCAFAAGFGYFAWVADIWTGNEPGTA